MATEPGSTGERKANEKPKSFIQHFKTDPTFRIEVSAVIIGLIVAVIYFFQWRVMERSLRVDQRAWVSLVIPNSFPLNGSSIPIITQIQDTGKTPALDVDGDYVATILNKGEEPAFDFSTGHPHNRLYGGGAVFPNAPIPLNLPVLQYGPTSAAVIVPDDTLRQDIANGNKYIIFYGRITYSDVFGVEHWTQFCTGSGKVMEALNILKKCISYNNVDRSD